MKKIGKGNLVLLALVLLTSLAFIWSTNYKEQSKLLADNITLPRLRPIFDQEETTNQLVAQIAQGDYSSIQGKWESERGVNYESMGHDFFLVSVNII